MRLFYLIILLVFIPFSASAEELPPSIKPMPPNISGFLTDIEFTYFRRAMNEARNKDWDAARSYRAGVTHVSASGLIDWQIALHDKNSSYFELAQAVRDLEDWPRHGRIRILAEAKIATSGMTSDAIVLWFAKWPPLSGDGKVAFAEALFANGQPDAGKAMLLDAWHHHPIDNKTVKQVLKSRGALLETADHETRVDMLLWRHQARAAQKLLSKTSKDFSKASKARIRLMRHSRGVDKAVEAVPASFTRNAGFLYERALWRRKKGRTKDALALVLAIPQTTVTHEGQKRLWTERHIHARRAIKDGEYQTAYKLAQAHGFERGADFAAGEWLAGWLALTKLAKPEIALKHFVRLTDNVSTPVSKARGHYWSGRAWSDIGDTENARDQYLKAAKFNFTYYGQLAQQQIAPGYLHLGNDPVPDEQDIAKFQAHPQIKAMNLLARIGDTANYRRFSYHLDDVLPGAVDHVMLAKLNREIGQNGIAIRAAKAALFKNEILPESLWPVLDIPAWKNRPEPALLLALSRQESELYPGAISHAGARGLMQLMPRTAKSTAKNQNKAYRKNWLTTDPIYNLDLGSAHLQELLDEFDGSYIMSAAAYNAGRSRVKKWIKDYGDPRKDVDPIDWVESIPFSETRNYVQRVLENVQVYRNRLSGQPTLIRLEQDLNRGHKT
ncbi:Soluble lytic murein transglycosylase precursor [hydrothermal vent metagenome]|uniref:Soluble lytic murein transglycosylase n=1 Tax=hydrothermal vent metagenome TaxID=652676 RepID=A0A3B0RTZ3_9ZZZZ